MQMIPHDAADAVALVSAIQRGDHVTLQQLLTNTPALATARIVDEHGGIRTLLHVAADWPGHFPGAAITVSLLLAAGTPVNAPFVPAAPTGAAETALHWAASCNDVAVLDALLGGGADIEAMGAVITGGTPMSDAVVFAQWQAAERLLARGARTTIWQAAALDLTETVAAFCAAVPTPAERDLTNALWHACRGGAQETAALLLAQGASLNWIGHDQKTPLDAAHDAGDAAFIAWLVAQGARRAKEIPSQARESV